MWYSCVSCLLWACMVLKPLYCTLLNKNTDVVRCHTSYLTPTLTEKVIQVDNRLQLKKISLTIFFYCKIHILKSNSYDIILRKSRNHTQIFFKNLLLNSVDKFFFFFSSSLCSLVLRITLVIIVDAWCVSFGVRVYSIVNDNILCYIKREYQGWGMREGD